MMAVMKKTGFVTGLGLCAALIMTASLAAQELSDSLKVVEETNQSAINSQQRIDQLSGQARKMLEEYQQILQKTEYQNAFNFQLKQLRDDQQQEIDSLNGQLAELNVTQMRILPMINSMADALEKFVVLDMPFRQLERVNGVIQLKQHLRSASLTLPDKYRLLLEAYQIENDYGRTIETYRDTLSREGEELSVEFLRIGRVALFYRTLDGAASGYWSAPGKQWLDLPEAYNRDISDAIRVAGNQVAPQLMRLPMINSGRVDQEQINQEQEAQQ